MATGRIGVTPTLRTRWSKAPAGGTTSLSGLDDNSVSLVYDVGYEAVYRNGVLLSRTNDYTATTGNSITLIDATIAGDIIEVFANQLLPLTNAIGNGQYTAKGALLSATAASTPAVLTVGSNDTVLTADSSTATGLKWATVAAGGKTLLSTTTLTGSSVTISSIDQTYKDLSIYITGAYVSSETSFRMRFNGITTSTYQWQQILGEQTVASAEYGNAGNAITVGRIGQSAGYNYEMTSIIDIYRYADSSAYTNMFHNTKMFYGGVFQHWTGSGTQSTAQALSSITFFPGSAGVTFSAGTVYVYGVK